MKLAKLKTILAMPAVIVSVVITLGTVMGWFGFQVLSPEDNLNVHVKEYKEFTVEATNQHELFLTKTDTIHEEIHGQELLMRSLVIRTCLRDGYAELVLQQLLPTCTSLGVIRTPETAGSRELLDSIG
jgi:hypothetical protein